MALLYLPNSSEYALQKNQLYEQFFQAVAHDQRYLVDHAQLISGLQRSLAPQPEGTLIELTEDS
ncbi:hypothetical protein D3C85_1737770 [compost metagenome]